MSRVRFSVGDEGGKRRKQSEGENDPQAIYKRFAGRGLGRL
jgi:hypothetical protein